MKKLNGGVEAIITTVIIVGLVIAFIIATVIPMSKQGDELIGATTSGLVNHQTTIGPR